MEEENEIACVYLSYMAECAEVAWYGGGKRNSLKS